MLANHNNRQRRGRAGNGRSPHLGGSNVSSVTSLDVPREPTGPKLDRSDRSHVRQEAQLSRSRSFAAIASKSEYRHTKSKFSSREQQKSPTSKHAISDEPPSSPIKRVKTEGSLDESCKPLDSEKQKAPLWSKLGSEQRNRADTKDRLRNTSPRIRKSNQPLVTIHQALQKPRPPGNTALRAQPDTLTTHDRDPPAPVSDRPSREPISKDAPVSPGVEPDGAPDPPFLQPNSQVISPQQLVSEVKSIYTALTMVEAKCIHVDKAQTEAIRSLKHGETELLDDHFKALISIHRTLLHEHHDFFLASQHPAATPALKRLASKYSMPARMWRHGIHSFLELLRIRLPQSREYMVSFIYFAYQMMCLLYETVPSFQDTWVECLGDLGRYRMAIEEIDKQDRDQWASTSRFWYSKAADRCPGVGRLYHHLAILARPHVLIQLYLYCRSLTSMTPFQSARESMSTLFQPFFREDPTGALPISRLEASYLKLHGMLCLRRQLGGFQEELSLFIDLLDTRIDKAGIKWREEGANIVIAAIGPLFDYGATTSPLRRLLDWDVGRKEHETLVEAQAASGEGEMPEPKEYPSTPNLDGVSNNNDLTKLAFEHALTLFHEPLRRILQKTSNHQKQPDLNILPYIHMALAFMATMAPLCFGKLDPVFSSQVNPILDRFPWEDICIWCNKLQKNDTFNRVYEGKAFIKPAKGDLKQLPEDYLIRGLLWTKAYFPDDWFPCEEVDDEERSIEHASTVKMRSERVFWLMCRLSSYGKWIQYDEVQQQWSVVHAPTWQAVVVSHQPSGFMTPCGHNFTVSEFATSDRAKEGMETRVPAFATMESSAGL